MTAATFISRLNFETEQADDLRKYGKSKEHRPNPIVQMGLFMDGDGIPISFNLFEGSKNEQPSIKPSEEKLIKDFGFDRFVVCTDAGLGSEANRRFNNINDRCFVVTQSLKKLKEQERASAMDNSNWKRLSDGKSVKDFGKIRNNPADYTDEIYYKERIHDGSSVVGQLMIVTYSPSYALYQKSLRSFPYQPRNSGTIVFFFFPFLQLEYMLNFKSLIWLKLPYQSYISLKSVSIATCSS